VDTVTRNQMMVHCEVLADSGQNVHDPSGRNDPDPTDGTVIGTDRHWTDSTR